MSYIIKCSDAFINIKLTETGRRKLAMGQLNFKYWSAGDSEVNYIREEVSENNTNDLRLSGSTNILKPKDKQPTFTSFLYSGGTSANMFTTLNDGQVNVMEIMVNNKAESRGFFSGSTLSGMTVESSLYDTTGTTINTNINGTDTINGFSGGEVGDLVMFKFTNTTVGNLTSEETQKPVPHLWYKIMEKSGGNTRFDRPLPNINDGSSSIYYIYKHGEVYDMYGTNNQSAYWDSGTLSFNTSCNVTLSATPVWNMNIPYSETMAGTYQSTQIESLYQYYGSQGYQGTMYPYLDYKLNQNDSTTGVFCKGVSEIDKGQKNIAILHYTNRGISNSYGEYFYIKGDKTTKVSIPGIMYHRKSDSTSLGMEFIASGDVKTIGLTNIEYVDLIEEPTLIGSLEPKSVGKVFPQLKLIIFDEQEIVSAMSYKSNRSWTLPNLNSGLVNPAGGTNGGILDVTKTIYITYALESDTTGLQSGVINQNYIKLSNNTSSSKDIDFKIEDLDLLKYMHKIESGWDGTGFYAYKFKVVYQIVDDENDRPDPSLWLSADFTNNINGHVSGETINPSALENQIPSVNNFIITTGTTTTNYDIDTVLGLTGQPDDLLFGDERFFYGNIEAFIGATTFKTVFDININTSNYDNTSNPTIDPTNNNTQLRVSEVGIFDKDNNLVIVGKLMEPIDLIDGNTILLELAIDF